MAISSDNAVKLLPLGDTAWTLEYGDIIDPQLHARVLGLQESIQAAIQSAKSASATEMNAVFTSIVDLVPTFRSLTVHYNPWLADGEMLGNRLLELARTAHSVTQQGRCWLLPVCFDEDFALDLAELAKTKEMMQDAVIKELTHAEFQVFMIGFMPGFPYMGGLPKNLAMPRLASPRKSLPARSLAIAGEMCAVYPWDSPGGWRLLGRTPVPMFSTETESPSLFASGDKVRLKAIDRASYEAMEKEIAENSANFDRQTLLVKEAL